MSKTRFAVLAALCLSFTGAGSASAEEQQSANLVSGSLEVGSLAGFTSFRGDVATSIGGEVGGYLKLWRITVGAEYSYLAVGNAPTRGAVERVAASGRFDVARFDRRFAGPNSALVLWVDASIGRQRGRWHDDREIARNDLGVGWGWLLEHRVRLSTRPRKLETVGWKFGWRLIAAPRYGADLAGIASCADKLGCDPRPDRDRHDVGLVVASSINFVW